MQQFKDPQNSLVKSHRNIVIALIVAVVVGTAGFFLFRSIASGFFASMAASTASVTGNAKLVSDS